MNFHTLKQIELRTSSRIIEIKNQQSEKLVKFGGRRNTLCQFAMSVTRKKWGNVVYGCLSNSTLQYYYSRLSVLFSLAFGHSTEAHFDEIKKKE